MHEQTEQVVGKPIEVHSDIDAAFGAYLCAQREARGISETAVAGTLGLSRKELQLLEAGAESPAGEELRGIAQAYRLSVVEVFLAYGLLRPEDLAAYRATS